MAQDTFTAAETLGEILLNKIQGDITELFAVVGAATSGSGVLVSGTDTTLGTLMNKVLAGTNVTLTQGSVGGNETLTISVDIDTDLVNDLAPKFAGDADGQDHKLFKITFRDTAEHTQALGTISGPVTVNLENGNSIYCVIGGDVIWSFTGWGPADTLTGCFLIMSGAVNYTYNWDGVAWDGGSEPNWSAGIDAVLLFKYAGEATVRGLKFYEGAA